MHQTKMQKARIPGRCTPSGAWLVLLQMLACGGRISDQEIRIFNMARRAPYMAPKAPSFTAETLVQKFSVRRVVFDTGFGFRVQIDMVPRAFGAALNPKS